MPDKMAEIRAALGELDAATEKFIETQIKAGKSVDAIIKVFKNEEKEIERTLKSYYKRRAAEKSAIDTLINLKNVTSKNNAQLKQYNKDLRTSVEEIKKYVRAEREEIQAKEALNKVIERETRTVEGHIKSLKDTVTNVRGVVNAGLQYAQVLGAQKISFAGAVKSLLDYNQGMFDLKRIQSVAGRGSADFSKAMELGRKSTYMSQVQLLKFANAAQAAYNGVKPTTTEVVKLGAAIQREFGPNFENAMAVQSDLLAIQNQFPSLYDNILTAHERMTQGLAKGDSAAIGSAQDLADSNIDVMMAMGASRQQIEKVMQLQAAQGEGQDALADVNKNVARTAQNAEDALLAAGKAGEPAINAMAKATAGLYGWMVKLPNTVLAVGAAFSLIDVAASKISLDIIKLVKEFTMLNAVRKTGAALPPSAGMDIPAAMKTGAGRTGSAIVTGKRGMLLPAAQAAARDAAAPAVATGSGSEGTAIASAGSGMFKSALKLGAGVAAFGVAVKAFSDMSYYANDEAKKRIDEEWKAATEDHKLRKGFLDGLMGSMRAIQFALEHPIVAGQKGVQDLSTASDLRKEEKTGVSKVGEIAAGESLKKGGGSIKEVQEVYDETLERWYMMSKKVDKIRDEQGKVIGFKGGAGMLEAKKDFHTKITDPATGRASTEMLKIVVQRLDKADQLKKKAKEEQETSNQIRLSYMKIKSEAETRLKIDQAITDTLNQQLQWGEQFGTINEKILSDRQRAAREGEKDSKLMLMAAEKLRPALEKAIPSDIAKSIDLDFNTTKLEDLPNKIGKAVLAMEPDIQNRIEKVELKFEPQIKNFEDAGDNNKVLELRAQKEKEINTINGEREGLLAKQKMISESILASQSKSVQKVQSDLDRASKLVDQQEKYNSLFAETVDLQRQLMESAQFGMGASVEMMQQQVDLASERIKQLSKYEPEAKKMLKAEYGIEESVVNQIKNAKTLDEKKAIISDQTKKYGGDVEKAKNAEMALMGYVEKQQKVGNQIMQQQLKIYEITKEVREGYLSAMKQMVSGFGQFGKIIGTQKRGASQLMTLVKKVTGTDALNTMALGGLQSKTMTAAGVGTKVGMEYGTGGLKKNLTKAEEAAQLNRIYKYQEYQDKAKKASEAGRGGVGTGVAPAGTQSPFKERVSKAPGKGGPNRAELFASASQVKTGNPMRGQRGANLPAGSQLPGGQGNVQNQQNAVTVNNQLGKPLIYSAQGGAADVTGGATSAPPYVMPPNTGPASTPETKAETLLKELRDIMKSIKDNGISVNAMKTGT